MIEHPSDNLIASGLCMTARAARVADALAGHAPREMRDGRKIYDLKVGQEAFDTLIFALRAMNKADAEIVEMLKAME